MTETTFTPEELEQLEVMLDMANGQLSDAVAMLARWAEDDDAITGATIDAIDPAGATITVAAGRSFRLDFTTPMEGLHDLPGAMSGLLAVARLARPHEPVTAMEELLNHDDDDLSLSRCTVTAVEPLSPRLTAISVSGLDCVPDHGTDQAVGLIIDLPDRPIPDELDAATFLAMGDDVRPKSATYSVRAIDPAAGTATFWVMTHGDDPATVSGWAATAAVGDALAVLGPHDGIVQVPDAPAFVGVCDETAFAAISATIDSLPPHTEVRVLAEIEQPGHEIPLTDRPGVEITWAYRSTATPDAPYALTTAVRRELTAVARDVFVMGAGESRCLAQVRRYLRNDVGLPAAQVSLIPYWRREDPAG